MNSTIKLKAEAKNQLRQFLLSSANSIPIDEAIRRAKKQWRKQKKGTGGFV